MDITSEFLHQTLDNQKKEILSSLHVALPGTVLAFHADTGLADIQPGLRRRTAEGELLPAPLLQNVPVFLPTADFTVSPGDLCLVIFADCCADGFLQTGQPVLPPSPRAHDLSDGFAFVGFRPAFSRS